MLQQVPTKLADSKVTKISMVRSPGLRPLLMLFNKSTSPDKGMVSHDARGEYVQPMYLYTV